MKQSGQDKGTLLLALVAGLSINGTFAALFSSIVPFSVFPIISLVLTVYCLHQRYQNRTIETTQVIMELIDLAKHVTEEDKRGKETGMSEDELAFYDALAENESAREVMQDEILKQIARDLTTAIRSSMTVDWAIRDSVQAKIKMVVKRLLKKYGYPPDKTEKAVEVVLEQTKLMCENDVR